MIELHLGGCKQNNQNRKFPDNEELGFLSGIHAYYEPEELVGKTLIAITNLPPRAMMGMESCGMLLSAVNNLKDSEDEELHLIMVDNHIPAGAKLYQDLKSIKIWKIEIIDLKRTRLVKSSRQLMPATFFIIVNLIYESIIFRQLDNQEYCKAYQWCVLIYAHSNAYETIDRLRHDIGL